MAVAVAVVVAGNRGKKKAKRKEMWKQLRPTEEVEPENKARAKIKNTKNPR